MLASQQLEEIRRSIEGQADVSEPDPHPGWQHDLAAWLE
jgi:hypothetical protein